MDVKTFIVGLVDKRFAGETLSPEVKEELQKEALERLNLLLLDRMIDALPDDDVETFNKMLTEKKPVTELQAFAKDHILEYNASMTTTLKEFQEGYLT